MTYVDGIGAVPQGAGAQGPSLTGLDSDAFLNLLVAQMRYQDPMSPTDHTAMLQQTSQFTQVETLQQVSELQRQMLGLSQAGMAAQMVGKEVAAMTANGESVSGIVAGVRFTSTGPVLDIGGSEVPMQSATEIRMPGDAAASALSGGQNPDQWEGPWYHDGADQGSGDTTL